MFFKKNKKDPVPSAPGLQSPPAMPTGQSIFAPNLHPAATPIDFGLNQAPESFAPQPSYVVPAPPPDAQSYPAFDMPQNEAGSLPPSVQDVFQQSETTVIPDWEQAASSWQPMDAAPQNFSSVNQSPNFLGETFESYTVQSVGPASSTPDDLTAWPTNFDPNMPSFLDASVNAQTPDFSSQNADFLNADSYMAGSVSNEGGFDSSQSLQAFEFSSGPATFELEINTDPFGTPVAQSPQWSTEADMSAGGATNNQSLWDNLASPGTLPGEQVPINPGAMLDSLHQQIYPADPFHSDDPDLLAGQAAFEEAAQFLFPDTMTAPMEWHEVPGSTGSPMDFASLPPLPDQPGLQVEQVMNLGPSIQQAPEPGFSDLSSLYPEGFELTAPEPAEHFISGYPHETLGNPEPQFDFHQFDSAALNLSEPLVGSSDQPFSMPTEFTGQPSELDPNAFVLNSEPDGFGSYETSASAYETGFSEGAALEWPTSAETEPLPDMLAGFPLASESSEFGQSFEWTPEAMPPMAASPENWPTPQAEYGTAEPNPVFETGSWQSEISMEPIAGDQDELADWELPMPPASPEENSFQADSFSLPQEEHSQWGHSTVEFQPSMMGFETAEAMQAMPESQMPDLLEVTPVDQDFYATEFELNEQGELVPVTGALSSDALLPLPFPEQADEGITAQEMPLPITPAENMNPVESESTEAFGENWEASGPSLSPHEGSQPADPFDATELEFTGSQSLAQSETPFSELTPFAAAVLPPIAQPMFSATPTDSAAAFSQDQIPQSEPAASDSLESQWHEPAPEPPSMEKPKSSASLNFSNLEVLGICPLMADRRLLVVHNNGIYALMGQVGLEEPEVSVLKVFDHNPIVYQNTFTAVAEAQAASQGMFVTQVGTWHGIISTFQDKITLHTELG